MEKKKILFFIYRLGGGGAARTMLNIVNHLDRSKFEPILVTLNFTYDYEQYVHDDVTFVKLNTKRLRSSIFPLAAFIRKQRPDIVFSTIPTYNTVAILAKLLSFSNTKLIVREAAFLGGTFKENMMLRIYGFLYRFAKKVIALSEGVKENLVDRYGVKREKIKVIYNPVDLAHINHQSELGEIAKQDQSIFNKGKKIIITAGRLVKEKDQETLIRAFAQIREATNSELVILGEGELEAELKEVASLCRVKDSVHFVGFQKNPYVYFKHADLFVLTSLNEGFGHVLVEAMATGTPVVSTRCKPGAEEVLQHGEFGRICNVGDVEDLATTMKEVLEQNDAARSEMIEKGYKRSRQFDATSIIKQYEEVFMETIDKGQTKKRMNG